MAISTGEKLTNVHTILTEPQKNTEDSKKDENTVNMQNIMVIVGLGFNFLAALFMVFESLDRIALHIRNGFRHIIPIYDPLPFTPRLEPAIQKLINGESINKAEAGFVELRELFRQIDIQNDRDTTYLDQSVSFELFDLLQHSGGAQYIGQVPQKIVLVKSTTTGSAGGHGHSLDVIVAYNNSGNRQSRIIVGVIILGIGILFQLGAILLV